ncbi:MAG: response regulator transcription factor, partial [Rhizobacter sp.]|nr:response regulator transcription factor [Chlorobiales bacterium]
MNASRPNSPPLLPIRTLIVDDEVLARKKLADLLKTEPEIALVGECKNGREAIEQILTQTPDLVFLDVQMPEVNGFDVLEALKAAKTKNAASAAGEVWMPQVVFVTAFDQHAVKAFEAQALDYLLKPFSKPRFQATLARARAALQKNETGAITERMMQLLQQLQPQATATQTFTERFAIKQGGRISFVQSDEIDWIEAEGNYVGLHCGRETYLLRETMTVMESKLDPA